MDSLLKILLSAHSGLRWVVLVLALLVLINSFFGMKSKGLFTKVDNNLSKYLVISCHLMLIIGLMQYFLGNKGFVFIKEHGIKGLSPAMRFYAIEHISTMIIAVTLITLGRSFGKRKDTSKAIHRTIFWWTLIGIVIMLIGTPWPFKMPWTPEGVVGGWG